VKAVVIDRFGGPEVLELREVPTPSPGRDEALIRVAAAGINFGDTVVRAGGAPIAIDFPLIPGSEIAGRVEQIGDRVKGMAVGDRVAAPLFLAGRLGGGYAEFVTLDADLLVPLPDHIGFDQATSLSMQGLTAWLLLRQIPVRGRTVLIHAAAGGVGSLLVQLAKVRGAMTVVATAGATEKLSLACRLGADVAVNYREEDWPERVRAAAGVRGPDVIFDSVGGRVRRDSLELLAPLGTLVVYGGSTGGGYASDSIQSAQVAGLIVKNQSVTGFSMWPLLPDRAAVKALLAECYAELFGLIVSGGLKTIVATPYGLTDAHAAHRALAARETVGKLILAP
jgi:NADPH2:quinone reductase